MPRKRDGPSSSRNPARAGKGRGGGAGNTAIAFIIGAAVAAGAGYLYLHSTPRSPVPPAPASSSPPSPTPEHTRLPAPTPVPNRIAPFGTSEDVFEAGAHLYAARCATCHGTPQKDAATTPASQQLWREARHVTAAETPSGLYDQIAAGAPANGMPAYAHTLTDTQIWQLALLLKSADQDLPDPVVNILNASPLP